MTGFELDITIQNKVIAPPDRILLRQYFDNLIDGLYKLTAKKIRKKASQNQFGYLFGYCFKEFQKALLSVGFEASDPKDVESICMQLFSKRSIVNRHTGEIIDIPARKRDFDTIDMMTFVESLRTYAAEKMNYYINEPDPMWFTKNDTKST
jgi:hypothetical protein